MSLRNTANDLAKTVDKLGVLCEKYLNDAAAEAAQSGRDSTDGGMSPRQLRQRLKAFVISKLSPKPVFGMPDPPLQFDGAPEARRFIAARGLPGL